jgi:hypothetical protein
MHAATLNTAQLGNTGLEITRVAFGAWAIGAEAGSSAGARRRTRSRSPRFTTR